MAARARKQGGPTKASPAESPAKSGAGRAGGTKADKTAGKAVKAAGKTAKKLAKKAATKAAMHLVVPAMLYAARPAASTNRASTGGHNFGDGKAAALRLAISAEAVSAQSSLYLVRSTRAAAAQALSVSDVSLNRESRAAQIRRLREFRNDTRTEALKDASRWMADRGVMPAGALKAGVAPGMETMAADDQAPKGLISSGIVALMTPEDANALRREVPNMHVLRNATLTLVAPSMGSPPAEQLPGDFGWHLDAIGQSAARAQNRAFTGKGVRIAVMDTGIQLNHPDLAANMKGAWRIRDKAKKFDASDIEKDPDHYDTDGHGTHVAGLIAGRRTGVAPDAELVSLLLNPERLATTFRFVACLDWVAENPDISLANISAGITPFNADMMPYVADLLTAGVLPFFSVGNAGVNNTCSPGNYIDGVSVGSVDPSGDRVSSFSSYAQHVWNNTIYTVPDLVAPGGAIWSCYPRNVYRAMSGTSMAAPIACAIAACLIEKAGGLITPLELQDELRQGCVPLAGEPPPRQGWGLARVPLR